MRELDITSEKKIKPVKKNKSYFTPKMANALLKTFYPPYCDNDIEKKSIFNLVNTLKEIRWCLTYNEIPTPTKLLQAVLSTKYPQINSEVYSNIFHFDKKYIFAYEEVKDKESKVLNTRKMKIEDNALSKLLIKICPFEVREVNKLLGEYKLTFTEEPDVFHLNQDRFFGRKNISYCEFNCKVLGAVQASAYPNNSCNNVKFTEKEIISLLKSYLYLYSQKNKNEFRQKNIFFDFILGGVVKHNDKYYLAGRIEFSLFKWFETNEQLRKSLYKDFVRIATNIFSTNSYSEIERRKFFIWVNELWKDFLFYIYILIPLDEIEALFINNNSKKIPLPIAAEIDVVKNKIVVKQIKFIWLDLPSCKSLSFENIDFQKCCVDTIELDKEQIKKSNFITLEYIFSSISKQMAKGKELYFDLFYKELHIYRWFAKSWREVLDKIYLFNWCEKVENNELIKYQVYIRKKGYIYTHNIYLLPHPQNEELIYYLVSNNYLKKRYSKLGSNKRILSRLFGWITYKGDFISFDYNLPPLFEYEMTDEEKKVLKELSNELILQMLEKKEGFLNYSDTYVPINIYRYFAPIKNELISYYEKKNLSKSSFAFVNLSLNQVWYEIGDFSVPAISFITNNSSAGLIYSAKNNSPYVWYLSYLERTKLPLFSVNNIPQIRQKYLEFYNKCKFII